MVSMTVLFWLFVALFAIIGAMRGWAKEILVTFSVLLAIFIIVLMESYLPIMSPDSSISQSSRFWIQTGIIAILVFFGYQTPNFRGLAGPRFARDRVQDLLLGLILGAINGYLIVGSIWYYMAQAGYPFEPYFLPPNANTEMGQAAINLLQKMPPVYLIPPWIYFAVAVAFLFVVVVFI
ncbi:MAG: CvpA family protein [Anaerolineales bacterium]